MQETATKNKRNLLKSIPYSIQGKDFLVPKSLILGKQMAETILPIFIAENSFAYNYAK